MTSEYLDELADRADPQQLWRLGAFEQMDLPPEKRRQLDTGVALRRHADHVRRLRELRGSGCSLLISPLTANGTATKTVPMPASHRKLLARRSNRPESKMTTTEARTNIAAATSLTALMQALRDTRNLASEEQDEINWTDLQTFGGDEPDSTLGVWSWDADSLLVGTCADDLKIISRDK